MVQANGVVTLLTDFGNTDVYVGVVKGVMLRVSIDLTLVDLTHNVPAHNIQSASFQLQNAYLHFPLGTVHLVIVDPGVGGTRRAIALETKSAFFVGPDNGVFSSILLPQSRDPSYYPVRAVVLNNPIYWYTPTPSFTFQGRDIFATAAAHLAKGISILDLGDPIPLDSLLTFTMPQPKHFRAGICGHIQAIDNFGNAISNIPAHQVQDQHWSVTVKGYVFPGHLTYSSVSVGEPLSLIGSHGWIELSIHGGSAQQWADLAIGDPIEIRW
jgi:hypothetical protein